MARLGDWHVSHVFQVQALSTPLIAIADEDHGLAVEQIEGCVFLVVDLRRHCSDTGTNFGCDDNFEEEEDLRR